MKKIILLIVSCIFSFASFSQEIEWQKTIGGSDDDQLYSIQQTSDGGYIMGGSSRSGISGNKTENNWDTVCNPVCSYDYWIIKTDASGNILWQNTIGGNQNDYLFSIHQTSDGGYILGGYSASNISGDKTENSIGSFDYWIVKTDASGNIQWQNTIGGSYTDFLVDIKQTNDGGYILGGYSNSNISGDKTENSWSGSDDYWIVKTDASGNIQWQNTIGGSDTDRLHSIQQTSDGGYVLGGYSESNISGDKTENRIGGADFWIVKTDSLGNIQWQNTIGGNNLDEIACVQQTADGGYILGGGSASNISGDKTENSWNNSMDYWIVKTDTAGNIQWQNTIGGTDDDEFLSILQTTDGGYVLGGYSWSNISGDKTENSMGGIDYWIIKTDAAGNMLWQNTIGGDNIDYFTSILQIADEGYVIGGSSQSNISFDKKENCIGLNDFWIIKQRDNYNLISGKLFIDANSNNLQDAGEPSVINKKVSEINTGSFSFSQNAGIYSISVLDSGNFSVLPAPINYYNTVPIMHYAYFPGMHQIDSLNDFAFQPTAGSFNDLCATITPMGNFRAGFDASYMVNYENVGTTLLNGTVIFFPDNDVTYVSSNPTATSVTTDSIVWNVGTLTPFQTGNILVTVHVNAGTPIGTLINSNVRIEPVAGDNYPGCNYAYWEVYTIGAVDPNAILVDRDTVLTTELSSPPYLNYIIYFQNTGNDTAFNVKVLNPIDTFKLQLNTLEFVASSHPMNMSWIPWERNMEFKFDNILLPDSNVNEPASHGFIRYRIKPKTTLIVGDSIENTAYIYFDFNAPVQTNTAVTEIVLPTGEEEFKVQSLKFKVFPNPVRDELTVNSNSLTGKKAEIKIYDLYGRKVYQTQLEIANSKLQTKINVSLFSEGVYFIEMKSGDQVLRGKFVKE